MKIAIIGHGNVGGALAQAWSRAGHTITIGARNPNSSKLQSLLQRAPALEVTDVETAAQPAEVILIATPPETAVELAKQLGPIPGKTLIDATNAIRNRPDPYPTAYHAFADLTAAEVVKCFNTTGFENMLDPNYDGQALDLFMAGDFAQAKNHATTLALDAGFGACYDFGGSDRVVLLEQFALAWINLAIFQGNGRGIGFKLLRR